MVVSDSSEIKIEVDSRGTNFLTSLDSRSETVNPSVKIKVLKESFMANLIKLKGDALGRKYNIRFYVHLSIDKKIPTYEDISTFDDHYNIINTYIFDEFMIYKYPHNVTTYLFHSVKL